ncbi:MAG: hypothetical protein ABIH42_07155 [Planctomycetota bacterium]
MQKIKKCGRGFEPPNLKAQPVENTEVTNTDKNDVTKYATTKHEKDQILDILDKVWDKLSLEMKSVIRNLTHSFKTIK